MTDDTLRVRHEAGNAVRRLVRARGGAFTDRPLIRSDPDGRTVSEPEPAAGIPAALSVEREARRLVLEYARYAREDGTSWHGIGEVMGFADHPPGVTSVAEHAFRYAVPGHAAADYFPWTCPSCRRLVRDYGPELAPQDAEQGHAAGCERLAATAAEWERNWADE